MRRERAETQVLAVRLRFEPNRLAPEYLADAYERVVPLVWRKLRTGVNPRLLARTQRERQKEEVA